MASPFTLKIKGLDKIQDRLKHLPKALTQEVGAELKLAAENVAKLAKIDAPADQGTLIREITTQKITDLSYATVSGANYSAFVEFGTRSKVQVPAEYASYAAQFKGASTGSSVKLFDAILEWVLRKGIAATFSVKTQRRQRKSAAEMQRARSLAFIIMIKILRVGVEPHPFFFHNFDKEKPAVIKRIQAIINSILD